MGGAGGMAGGGVLAQPGASLQFHHGLPRLVVVDQARAAQLLVLVVHEQVSLGLRLVAHWFVRFPLEKQGRGD